MTRLIRPNYGLFCSIGVTALILVAAQSGGLLSPTSIKNIAITALGIGFIIFVHEMGHFLVAKACGVKCEKFYLGFDVYGLKLAKFQWGETEYGIGAVPLGGYVKMLGQDDNVANAEGEIERTRVRNADGTVTLDPRSYTAKSVPQRMAIISAGVIMNLIFAVIFASVAFTLGVEYRPCVIGATSGGGAAWKAGIEPGDRIVQFGKSGSPSLYLRYETDLQEGVFLHDPNQDLDLLVEKPNGERKWVATRPQLLFSHKSIFGDKSLPRLGVGLAQSLDLGKPEIPDDTKLASGTSWWKEIREGDRIIAANGEPLKDYVELSVLEAEDADQPIKLTIERTLDEKGAKLAQPQQYEVVAPPKLRKELGISFRSGGISTVLPGSVAEMAGILRGDVIVKVNDEAVTDPTLLPVLFARLGGKETRIVLRRGSDKSEEVETTVTPAKYRRPTMSSPAAEIAIDGLGVSFPVTSYVERIDENLTKQKVDVAPGDLVISMRREHKDEAGKTELGKWGDFRENQPDGDWIAYLADDFELEAIHLRLRRGEKTLEVRIVPLVSKNFAISRNIPAKPMTEIRQAASATEALQLGLRETKEAGFRVLTFLRKLVTGGVSPTNLGGPLTIAYVANQHASVGIPKFLLFLTLISANLAIVNFLPIPVLDGGHMMFLTAEAIRGKPVDEKWLIRLTVAGFFFVMGLMLFVISLDVLRFSGVNV